MAAGSAGNPWLIGVIADLFEGIGCGEYFDSSLPQRGGILSSHTSTRVPHPALLDMLTRVPDSSPPARMKRPSRPVRPLTRCGSLRKILSRRNRPRPY